MSVQRFSSRQLRERRKSAGYTRERLAVDVGRSHSSIQLYERGVVAPQAAIIGRLAACLGCDVADLFEDDPDAIRTAS